MAVLIINFLATLIILRHRVYGLNVNDILNVNYLPGTLLLDNLMIDGDNNANNTSAHNSSNGNWNDAFSTMEFHRYVSLMQLTTLQMTNGQNNYFFKSSITTEGTCFGLY
jgi:hypothetical protein